MGVWSMYAGERLRRSAPFEARAMICSVNRQRTRTIPQTPLTIRVESYCHGRPCSKLAATHEGQLNYSSWRAARLLNAIVMRSINVETTRRCRFDADHPWVGAFQGTKIISYCTLQWSSYISWRSQAKPDELWEERKNKDFLLLFLCFSRVTSTASGSSPMAHGRWKRVSNPTATRRKSEWSNW